MEVYKEEYSRIKEKMKRGGKGITTDETKKDLESREEERNDLLLG